MEEIKNRNDLSNFIKNNSSSHIIIKIGAEWCGPCKTIKPYVEKSLYELKKKVKDKKIDTKIIFLELNADNDSDCCSFLRVKGIPHIIYIKNGEINQNLVGCNIEKLQKLFNYIYKQIVNKD